MLDFDIRLDNVSLLDRIDSVSISLDRSAVHNSVSVTSSDPTLYDDLDPDTLPGTGRLSVTLGGDTLLFLLERPVNGQDSGCTFGGRSLSALETEEYAGQVYTDLLDYEYDATAKRISTVMAGLLTSCALDFGTGYGEDDADNSTWYLADYTWSWSGAPIDGVADLASRLGGYSRSLDDGTIEVRPWYPCSPGTLNSLSAPDPDIVIDADDIIGELSFTDEPGDNYNAILSRVTSEPDIPEIVVEEGDYLTGTPYQTAYIRAYWQQSAMLITDPDTWATSGTLEAQGASETVTETVTFESGTARISQPIKELITVDESLSYVRGELYISTDGDDEERSVSYTSEGFINDAEHIEEVTFQDGTGSVGHKIDSINSVTWTAGDGGTVSWTEGTTELRCTGQGGIAEVSYQSEYQRWKLTGAEEKAVLVALAEPGEASTLYTVAGTDGDRRAPDLERTAEGGYYGQWLPRATIYDSFDRVRYSFEIAADVRIRDGMMVKLDNYPTESQAIMGIVDKVTLNVESVKISYSVEVVAWPE